MSLGFFQRYVSAESVVTDFTYGKHKRLVGLFQNGFSQRGWRLRQDPKESLMERGIHLRCYGFCDATGLNDYERAAISFLYLFFGT